MTRSIQFFTIAAIATFALFVSSTRSIADTTTKESSASMGTYVGKMEGKPAKIELKEDQVAMITATMPDPSDSTKMVESKSEGKWLLDDKTVTITLMTMDGKTVTDDDAHKKIKLLVDDHGDKLVGDDKMPAELKRQS